VGEERVVRGDDLEEDPDIIGRRASDEASVDLGDRSAT
jgi:hypothetical protein